MPEGWEKCRRAGLGEKEKDKYNNIIMFVPLIHYINNNNRH